jgi:hypothetical protein
MPLLDHFHPPLFPMRRWQGFHGSWANAIVQQLSPLLPAGYFAEPLTSAGGFVEIDVATLRQGDGVTPERGGAEGPAVWTPPRPLRVLPVTYPKHDAFEVRVYEELDGPRLRAAVELVSPANKDRPLSRRTFVDKCAGYLEHGVAVVVVDIVTNRTANFHADILQALEAKEDPVWQSPTGLYAVAYRPVPAPPQVETWPVRLALGEALPALPLWLDAELSVPLRLEESYAATCTLLRIGAGP